MFNINKIKPIVLATLIALMAFPCHADGKVDVAKEYQYKLVFLYKFAMYVVNNPPTENEQIRISVVGSNPFGGSFQRIAVRRLRQKQLVPVVYPNVNAYQDSDIVFISRSLDESERQRLRAKLKGKSVLVVSEDPGSFPTGSIMNFQIGGDGTIKIQLDSEEAAARQLEIDARLMKICQIVQ